MTEEIDTRSGKERSWYFPSYHGNLWTTFTSSAAAFKYSAFLCLDFIEIRKLTRTLWPVTFDLRSSPAVWPGPDHHVLWLGPQVHGPGGVQGDAAHGSTVLRGQRFWEGVPRSCAGRTGENHRERLRGAPAEQLLEGEAAEWVRPPSGLRATGLFQMMVGLWAVDWAAQAPGRWTLSARAGFPTMGRWHHLWHLLSHRQGQYSCTPACTDSIFFFFPLSRIRPGQPGSAVPRRTTKAEGGVHESGPLWETAPTGGPSERCLRAVLQYRPSVYAGLIWTRCCFFFFFEGIIFQSTQWRPRAFSAVRRYRVETGVGSDGSRRKKGTFSQPRR